MRDNVIEFLIQVKDKFSAGLGKMSHGLGKVKDELFSLKGLIATVGIGVLAKQFIDAGNTVESLRIRLNTLMGSAREGNQVFQDMTKYASQVPFEYENIMQGATQLAGVLKGGAKDIAKWMPLIGDLAATSGLSIQETTDQVSRMLSAGAGAADLFRERGVTAMLGFQAGVTYSADETRKKLMDAWQAPMSRFRGATEELASTLPGILSMIKDKWFAIRTTLMDTGILDYIKAIAKVIDTHLGVALAYLKTNVKDSRNQVIGFGEAAFDVLGKIGDMVRILHIGWLGLKEVFAVVAAGLYTTLDTLTSGYVAMRQLFNKDYEPPMAIKVIHSAAVESRQNIIDIGKEIKDLASQPWPSEKVAQYKAEVEKALAKITAVKHQMASMDKAQSGIAVSQGEGDIQKSQETAANAAYKSLAKSLLTQKEMVEQNYQDRSFIIEDAYQNDLIDYETYAAQREALEEQHQAALAHTREFALRGSYEFGLAMRHGDYMSAAKYGGMMLKQAAGQNKTMFALWKAYSLAKAIVSLPTAVMESYQNGGGYPLGIIPAAIMAGIGAAQIAAIASQQYSGQAHAGLTNVPREGTYLLQAGERVIPPAQNQDLSKFLTDANGSGGGGRSIEVGEMHFHLFENVSNASALLNMDNRTIQEVIAEKFYPAMDTLFNQGVMPEAYARFKR